MQHAIRFIFLVILAFISSALRASDAVTLVVGGEKPFLHAKPMLVDGEVYASLPALNTVGAKFYTDREELRDGQEVEITPATGTVFTCKARLINGTLMVPLRKIAGDLGAAAEWSEPTKTLRLRARVEGVRFDGSQLHVDTSYPVTYSVSWWKTANRLILDLRGVEPPSTSSSPPIANSTKVGIRIGSQRESDGVRIVLDMPSAVTWRSKSPTKTESIVIAMTGYSPSIRPGTTMMNPKPQISRTEATPVDSSQQPPPPVGIAKIDYVRQSIRRVEVFIAADGPIEYQTSMTRDPDVLIVDMPNAVVSGRIEDIAVGHPILQGIRVEQSDRNVRVTMDLTRVVGFDAYQDEATNRLKIALEMPKGAGGPLSGKTIVLDPGHGGKAKGAIGLDGGFEKTSNLAIAQRVRKLLMDAGVAAILTRSVDRSLDEDVKQDLIKRAEFAARHSADAFLSIHSNSIPGPKCPTGLETYYHGRDMSGRALAYCVHSEIVRAGLLTDLRVRSDYVLYSTGLGVLRNAVERFGLPSALIEVGYVKHPDDLAKLRDPKFQEKVAQAIVRGFKLYFEGNPSPTRRTESSEVPEARPAGRKITVAENPVEKPAEKPADKPAPLKKSPTRSDGPKRPGVN